MAQQVSITFTIDQDRATKLQKSFPEFDGVQELAPIVAQLITNELIDLLAGQKRYMSLSHQYAEWLQQLYEAVLPDEEYTYERIYNEFNFPPGTAQYLARVLRHRQNTTLHDTAKSRLQDKVTTEIQAYDQLLEDDKPS